MQIQWYPGHMTKARRMMAENLRLIDVVIELVDARAPEASRNPDFDDLFAQKSRALLLNKCDLADPAATKRWVEFYRKKGVKALEMVATESGGKKKALSLIEEAAREKVERLKQKGVRKTVRVMIVGIPNVGKSTFINKLSGSTAAVTGNRPGVTKGKQWVKISPLLELMDTPGMLWPKLEDQQAAKNLAFLGSIRDEIMDGEELAGELLRTLSARCPRGLAERSKKLAPAPEGDPGALLDGVCASRGFILPGGVYDTERAARVVLEEFRSGKIGRITLELPPKTEEQPKEEPKAETKEAGAADGAKKP